MNPFLVTCCDSIKLTTTNSDVLSSAYSIFVGNYVPYSSMATINDYPVYQLEGQSYCLYYAGGRWYVNTCNNIGSAGGFLWSSSGLGCAHSEDAYVWEVNTIGQDSDMKAVCEADSLT